MTNVKTPMNGIPGNQHMGIVITQEFTFITLRIDGN